MNNTFKISGMHCGACQKVIEKKLMKIEGVEKVSVELSGEAIVTANRSINIDEVELALKGTDYKVS
ncbi:MAG: heavy metal-associated domain-containing protein [Microgenomates group bacterium]|jgi:copper chaperone CopZ